MSLYTFIGLWIGVGLLVMFVSCIMLKAKKYKKIACTVLGVVIFTPTFHTGHPSFILPLWYFFDNLLNAASAVGIWSVLVAIIYGLFFLKPKS